MSFIYPILSSQDMDQEARDKESAFVCGNEAERMPYS